MLLPSTGTAASRASPSWAKPLIQHSSGRRSSAAINTLLAAHHPEQVSCDRFKSKIQRPNRPGNLPVVLSCTRAWITGIINNVQKIDLRLARPVLAVKDSNRLKEKNSAVGIFT